MRKYLISLSLATSLYSNNNFISLDSITISTPKEDLLNTTISTADDLKYSKEQTLDEQLNKNSSYLPTKDMFGLNTVSFRGIKPSATNVIVDLIPLYRTNSGYIDLYNNYNIYDVVSNMGSIPSSLGVSSMGSDIELISKKPKQNFEAEIITNVSTFDNNEKVFVKHKDKDNFIQLSANRYDRDSYKLSNNFTPTTEQPSSTRINSDKEYTDYELWLGHNLSDNDSVSFKYKESQSNYGIEPNVYDNSSWDAYSRMQKKDLKSLYGYYDHINDNFETNARVYYDQYKDMWTLYNDNSYTSHYPLSLYDDSRIGTVLKTTVSNDNNDKLSYVLNIQEDQHIWKEDGRGHTPTFEYQSINTSIIGKKNFNKISLDSAITYKDFRPTKVDYDNDPSFTQSNDGTKNNAFDYQMTLGYLEDINFWYTSFSKTTKTPTMEEMFAFFPWYSINTNLKAEESNNVEIGYKRFLNNNGLFSIGMFHYDIKDKIVSQNGGYINLDEATHKGSELKYQDIFFDIHKFSFGYMYLIAKDGDNNDLELIPKNRLVLEDKIMFNSKYTSTIQYIYLSDRIDNTNNSGTKTLSDYSFVNLFFNATLYKHCISTIGVKNLFDTNYEVAYGFPSEGRNLYGQIVWNF